MSYIKLKVSCDPNLAEALTALMAELPFEAFEETSYGVDAYIPTEAFDDEVRAGLTELTETIPFTFEESAMPDVNWNEEWEQNFSPVEIEGFVRVRASFHPDKAGFKHEILINPKMAFGTGHHATTQMMMGAMKDRISAGDTVLDFGCGTGILAFLALKLGAQNADAVDIEAVAIENAIENAALNGIENVRFYTGDLGALPTQSGPYNIILANIQRNIILENISALNKMLATEGYLFLSGLLATDEGVVAEAAEALGLSLIDRRHEGDWICLSYLN